MTTLKDSLHIPDTQGARDERHVAIQRVGVRAVRYPINRWFSELPFEVAWKKSLYHSSSLVCRSNTN